MLAYGQHMPALPYQYWPNWLRPKDSVIFPFFSFSSNTNLNSPFSKSLPKNTWTAVLKEPHQPMLPCHVFHLGEKERWRIICDSLLTICLSGIPCMEPYACSPPYLPRNQVLKAILQFVHTN
ncbi:hypothetical protein FRX31_021236 [Thalictrum thalictroides]|uniref:Uncharacterized protein n=1 Tax=Thalictrum thalictroides TaxID=46969 RepID=A0A7J6VWV8_THATH|nr:hypothetical protein FRX31_021236 [Thalictrum thalictroides]